MPQVPQRVVQQVLPSTAEPEPVLPAYSSQSLWGFVAEIDGPDAFAGGMGTGEDDAASGGAFQESLSMTAGQGQTAASLDMHDIEQLLMGDECAADMSGYVSAVGHLLFDDSSAMQQLSADWLTDFQRSNYAAFTPDTGAVLVPGQTAAAQQAVLSSAEHATGMPSSGGPSLPVQQGVWQLGATKGRQDGSAAGGGEYHWGQGFVP
ncbi:unnamed protein product [Closterium sp. NIES-65]|nr:unnamed protein product [Closterium sp. NIES-65]